MRSHFLTSIGAIAMTLAAMIPKPRILLPKHLMGLTMNLLLIWPVSWYELLQRETHLTNCMRFNQVGKLKLFLTRLWVGYVASIPVGRAKSTLKGFAGSGLRGWGFFFGNFGN